MEPHASLAIWEDGDLLVYDSIQGTYGARRTLAEVFELDPKRVRVIAQHVGGGFGSKGTPRPQAVLAAIAARMVERPVKCALRRQQMFASVGYRTPTIQRVRLGATSDGTLTAIAHDAFEQTSTVREFAEQTCTPTRMMYAAPDRLTRHRLVALDVPTPSWMRAPGECPGCSRSSPRSTSSRPPAASTRSSCASATSPTSTPRRASRSPRATSSAACARAPSASAGPIASRAPTAAG